MISKRPKHAIHLVTDGLLDFSDTLAVAETVDCFKLLVSDTERCKEIKAPECCRPADNMSEEPRPP